MYFVLLTLWKTEAKDVTLSLAAASPSYT